MPAKYSLAKRLEVFWGKVVKTESCWLWTGCQSRGYGYIHRRENGKLIGIPAHRFAYEVLRGPIPKHLQIDHLCRKRLCVNPQHLEIVAQRINVLRGIGASAKAARATHCPSGHLYDLINTRWYRGRRYCKACSKERIR